MSYFSYWGLEIVFTLPWSVFLRSHLFNLSVCFSNLVCHFIMLWILYFNLKFAQVFLSYSWIFRLRILLFCFGYINFYLGNRSSIFSHIYCTWGFLRSNLLPIICQHSLFTFIYFSPWFNISPCFDEHFQVAVFLWSLEKF